MMLVSIDSVSAYGTSHRMLLLRTQAVLPRNQITRRNKPPEIIIIDYDVS